MLEEVPKNSLGNADTPAEAPSHHHNKFGSEIVLSGLVFSLENKTVASPR